MFTGALQHWTRSEIERQVEELGGRAASSVSSETDYVIAGPGAGAKLAEAKKYQRPIFNEEEFRKFLDEKLAQ